MAQHPPNPLDDHTPKQPLTGFQASQLFINCCFALSLAGILGLFAAAVATKTFSSCWPIPLSLILVFTVWRQYYRYYIPLQAYRCRPETESEELVTLLTTLTLGALPIVYAAKPLFGLVAILITLVLTWLKLHQMERALPRNNGTTAIRPMLRDYKVRLYIYASLLLLGIVIYLAIGPSSKNPTGMELFFTSVGPLPLYWLARWFYRDLYLKGHGVIEWSTYDEELAKLWPRPID